MDIKHIHVIGICGVATSALAIAFHKKGMKVTGSDKGFFPPVSTELEKAGILFYAGWHPEKMIADGLPDVVIAGTASGSQNPETILAKEKKIPIYSFAEAIGKFFVKEKSIVSAGTWGKTSSSAMLSFILKESGLNPTYMFGGISLSHKASAELTDSEWSVFEGDEYKSSPTDETAKFFYYKPTHLLLTGISWDHADLYKTEEKYFETFKKLISIIPSQGEIIACGDDLGIKKILNKERKITFYGKTSKSEYFYFDLNQTKNGIDFKISDHKNTWEIHSPMLGEFQAENITGCFAMASKIGIVPEKIISAISTFKGLKRRLEKRVDGEKTEKNITIFDDIAHSPEKAKSVLENLRNVYQNKIIAIFEPNTGGRKREALSKYDNAFEKADVVLIPRLTSLKMPEDKLNLPIEGDELAEMIGMTHKNTLYIPDDQKLVEYIENISKNGDVIVFMGSHGFRNMIENICQRYQRSDLCMTSVII